MEMKKILSFTVAVCALVFALSSCADITESIKNTRWVADLSVYEEFDTGEAVIMFTSNGYRFSLTAHKDERPDSPGNMNAGVHSVYIGEIFYEYPTVKIPYVTKDENKKEITFYWTGTLSEDGKQMIIKEFVGLFEDSLMSGVLHDVVFTRK